MSKYIYGIHDAGGSYLMLPETPGWVVITEAIGHDPTVMIGRDYSVWNDAGLTVISRLNNDYHPGGTLPQPQFYEDFAQRCANFVAESQGCFHWIIGNEPCHSQERPDGIPIYPADYARCYSLCRIQIKLVQPEAMVLTAAIAPWNIETGDWLEYFENMLLEVVRLGGADGIALHTYTHGDDPALITSMQTMDPPFEDRLYHFRAYLQFFEKIPFGLRHVPLYITETNQGDQPWLDENNGWVQEAYREIDGWNAVSEQKIRCLCLYRWGQYDQWFIEDKQGVIDGFVEAMTHGYRWDTEEPPMDWVEVFNTSMNEGFYDYGGAGELTVPVGSVPLYEHDGDPETALSRPEYAERHDPETHTPPNAAGFFSMFSTMEAALVWEIPVKPGDQVRAVCWAMTVDGGGGPATRLGIAIDNPGEGAIQVEANDEHFAGVLESRVQWGDWQTVEHGDWGHLWSPVVTATRDRVWIVMNGRQDWSAPGHTHWDDLSVEVLSGSPPIPPTPGEYRVVVYDPDGNVVAEASFPCGGNVNPEVCSLAQGIVALTCLEA